MTNGRLLGAMASMALILAGCSSTTPDEEALGQIIDLDQVAYPLAAFDLNDAELETVLHARYLLTQRCAGELGAVLPERQHGRNRPFRQDQYGMYDEQTARTWAYSLDGPSTTAPGWEEEINRDSPLFEIAAGCRDTADRTLGWAKAAVGEPDPLPGLESKAWNTSKADPAVRRAAKDWQRCMAKRGHDHDDPALAPYSHWTSKRMDADISAQRQLVAENRARLDGHRRGLDEVVRKAAAVH